MRGHSRIIQTCLVSMTMFGTGAVTTGAKVALYRLRASSWGLLSSFRLVGLEVWVKSSLGSCLLDYLSPQWSPPWRALPGLRNIFLVYYWAYCSVPLFYFYLLLIVGWFDLSWSVPFLPSEIRWKSVEKGKTTRSLKSIENKIVIRCGQRKAVIGQKKDETCLTNFFWTCPTFSPLRYERVKIIAAILSMRDVHGIVAIVILNQPFNYYHEFNNQKRSQYQRGLSS